MNALLDRSMHVSRKHFMAFVHPPEPVAIQAINRPSLGVLQATFPWIDCIGPDSSVTLVCSLYIGAPIIGEKTRRGDRAISQVIDDRFNYFQPSLLGIQHAWELCRNQYEIPFLRLLKIHRIWFYGLSVYESSGGELRPVMVRKSDTDQWLTRLIPACDYYPNTDCLAFAQL